MSNHENHEQDKIILGDDTLELAAGGSLLNPNPPSVNITYGYDTTT